MKDMTNVSSIQVKSSTTIDEVGYDSHDSVLFVKFKGGSSYKYNDVPPGYFAQIKEINLNNGSVGSFFAKHIKPKFPGIKI